MNKEFIPYEQALEIKELGFDEPCLAYYWMNIDSIFRKPALLIEEPFDDEWCLPAPLYQQAFRWFREKHNMQSKVEATFNHDTPKKYYYFCQVVTDTFIWGDGIQYNWTYEEAELACLKKLIEIVKNK